MRALKKFFFNHKYFQMWELWKMLASKMIFQQFIISNLQLLHCQKQFSESCSVIKVGDFSLFFLQHLLFLEHIFCHLIQMSWIILLIILAQTRWYNDSSKSQKILAITFLVSQINFVCFSAGPPDSIHFSEVLFLTWSAWPTSQPL